MVTGLDEVMDWPAVWNPDNPSYKRLWGMIEATFAARGVVEGHASGLRDLPSINAFAAAGLASDHEVQTPEETWDKLTRGLFVELRVYAMAEIIAWLLGEGPAGLVADRVHDGRPQRQPHARTRRQRPQCAGRHRGRPCARDRDPVRSPSIRRGTCASRPYVGSLSPGRFGDVVLLSDVGKLDDRRGLGRWRARCPRASATSARCPRSSGRTGRPRRSTSTARSQPQDFALAAEPGRDTMKAAVIRPFHWHPEFYTLELPVRDGAVQRDSSRGHHQIRHRRPLLRRRPRLEDVLARLRAAHAGHGARLLGRA